MMFVTFVFAMMHIISLNPDNFKKASEQAIKADKNLWNPFLSWLGV